MLTACPRCGVHLAVTATALRAARGLCRCGACRALFPAWAYLIDPPPAAILAGGVGRSAAEEGWPRESTPPPVARDAPPADAPVSLRAALDEDARTPNDEPGATPSMPLRAVLEEDIAAAAALAGEPGAPHPDGADAPAVPFDSLPSTLPAGRLRDPSWLEASSPTPRRGLRFIWRVALVLLAVLLMAQLFLMQAGTLAANWPPSRPWIARLWQELSRPAPWRRDLERLRVLRSDVRDHPQRAGSLMVTVTLQNDALFEQPFPAVELTLGDALGEQVGRRRFEPDLYLGNDWPRPAFMPIGRPVDVLLELAGSHEGATAFTIELQASE